MTPFEYYSLILAVITGLFGTVAGLYNTWYSWSKDQVKLRVTPKLRWVVNNIEWTLEIDNSEFLNLDQHLSEQNVLQFSVEVVNLSTFPITITEVGIGKGKGKNGNNCLTDLKIDRVLPQIIKSRDSFTFKYGLNNLETFPQKHHRHCCFVRTACGKTFWGTSSILKTISQKLSRKMTGI